MLKVSSLSYFYPKTSSPVFSDLNLSLEGGAVYGLLGSNGAGKSTLLYLMSGLLRPQAGEITYNGVGVGERRPETLADIFLVPEEFELPAVRLDEFIKVNAPFYPKFSAEEMDRYLAEFRIEGRPHLGRLSMGQKKKVLIAFALACRTSLLLMDEPTNGLDIPGKSEFRRALVSAMTDDRTVVISTHQVRDLDRILDHVIIVDSRRIVLNAPIDLIQQRLSFTLEPLPDESALYCQPTAGGFAIIRRQTDPDRETAINLESLFELTITNPQDIL